MTTSAATTTTAAATLFCPFSLSSETLNNGVGGGCYLSTSKKKAFTLEQKMLGLWLVQNLEMHVGSV
jgi:hypothetical protein